MIGLPYETIEDMRQTIQLMKKINPDSINLCTFTPYPGTELYDYCINNKLLVHDEKYEIFKHIGHHSTENFFLEHVSIDDYQKLLKECLHISTSITNALTLNKIRYKIKDIPYRIAGLTAEKIKMHLKSKYKTILKNN